MKPQATQYAWVNAAESAVIGGLNKPNFWNWARAERTYVLLASLDSLSSEFSATMIEVSLEAYQDCWCAAYAAAQEIIADRRQRQRQKY